jgi:hypothetical protein
MLVCCISFNFSGALILFHRHFHKCSNSFLCSAAWNLSLQHFTAFSFADNLCPEISVITTESKNILLRHFYQKSEEKVRLPLRFSSEVKYCVIYA